MFTPLSLAARPSLPSRLSLSRSSAYATFYVFETRSCVTSVHMSFFRSISVSMPFINASLTCMCVFVLIILERAKKVQFLLPSSLMMNFPPRAAEQSAAYE